MSFNVRESLLAYSRMFLNIGLFVLFLGIIYLIAERIRG